MASAAGILSRNFVNRALFGKTGYFMLSNVAQGSCQSSNANENVSVENAKSIKYTIHFIL